VQYLLIERASIRPERVQIAVQAGSGLGKLIFIIKILIAPKEEAISLLVFGFKDEN